MSARQAALDALEGNRWVEPGSYFGFNPTHSFLVLSYVRAVGIVLDESNWQVAHKRLKPVAITTEPKGVPPACYTWSAGHSGDDTIEYLMVHEDAPTELLAAAADMVLSLQAYPALDEADFSKREDDAILKLWDEFSLDYKRELCAEHGVLDKVMQSYPPAPVYEELRDTL